MNTQLNVPEVAFVLPAYNEEKDLPALLERIQSTMKDRPFNYHLIVVDDGSKDRTAEIVLEAAAAKYFASEMVGRGADKAVQIFGGAGYVADYGIERLYRDVRIFRIYEGTSQVQQIIIARETMKRGG